MPPIREGITVCMGIDMLDSLSSARKDRMLLRETAFLCAYQPVKRAVLGDWTFYHEGLARLRTADGIVHSGGYFIPQLESCGDIIHLDQQLLSVVINDLKREPNLQRGCNVSAVTFQNHEIRNKMLSSILASGSASRLILEITETSPVRDAKEINQFIKQAQQTGCRIAMDDFGSGHLSPSQLLKVEPDIIKIDASMLWNIRGKSKRSHSLHHIVDFALCIAPVVVVEGVETAEQWGRAVASGATHIQGYYVGRPSMGI
jgi:EAL domain-containing protein (putative c-di-GMP-specific phosphodiesterase class I)